MREDCPDTLAAQEQAVLDLLRNVDWVRAAGGAVLLTDAEGQPLLRLTRPMQVPLQGRQWRLQAYRDAAGVVVKALAAPDFTLTFENAEQLAGRACAGYRANYSRDDRTLQLTGPIAMIRDACRTEPRAEAQGVDYFAALEAARAYRVYANSLLLRDEDGRMLASFSAITQEGTIAGGGTGMEARRVDDLPAAPEPLLPQLR